jgi:5-methyltetrahydrofolate--homocysteine methyltransferase
MYNVTDIAAVKARLGRFWRHESIGRPYVLLTAPKNGNPPPAVDLSYPRRVRAARTGDYASVVRDFECLSQSIVHYGESMPIFSADLCPDQFAAFYGADIVARDGETTTWIGKNVADTLDALDLTFHRDAPALVQLEQFIRQATEMANGNFLVSLPDFHSNLDTLSALLSPMNLCYELMDSPDALSRQLQLINDQFKTIYDIFYAAGDMQKNGTVNWIPVWCEGRSSAVQCDFSCMMSPRDARKYVIPSIEAELDALDHAIYHYDGEMALGHFDDVLAIERLDGIQWVPGAGKPRTIEYMDLLKKIQKAGKSTWIYDWSAEEILADRELDPDLTIFSLGLPSEAAAEDFMERLERKYKR